MHPFFVFGSLKVPAYGLCIALGVLISGFLASFDCIRKKISWEYMLAIAAAAVGVGFLGAKLLFLFITYTPEQIVEIVRSGGAMRLISGGFVFYGGLIFGVLTAVLMAKLLQCKISVYENVLIKAVPLAHAFGRVGCFFAGCCYGKPTDSILGIAFDNPLGYAPADVPLFPVQLMEAGMNLILVFVMWIIDAKCPKNRILLPLYLMVYAVERFVLEYFRFDAERGIYLGVSTSQWISLGIFVLGVALLAYRRKMSNKIDK